MTTIHEYVRAILLENTMAQNIPWASYQSAYEPWEKGLIVSWGRLLSTSYHDIDSGFQLVDEEMFEQEFEQSWLHRNNDEWTDEFNDWLGEAPPKYGNGEAMFDKQRLTQAFEEIARKSPAKSPIILYRGVYSEFEFGGWNSFSTVPGQYDKTIWKAFRIEPGASLIFADGLADDDEVIANVEDLIASGRASEIPYGVD